jgi:integrase
MNKLIEINPCKGLKFFKIITPEKGILTKTELETLFSEKRRSQIWPEPVHFAVNYIAASTGLRIGEILALRPGDYSDGVLTVSHSFNPDDGLKPTKNGKSRSISLDKTLGTLFTDVCQGKQKDEYIFSVNNGKSPMAHKTVYKRFWKALETVGIDKTERVRRKITFHSYRHGVNTMLLETGIPPETVRLLTGHSPQMTERYSHLQLPIIILNKENTTCYPKKNETGYSFVPSFIQTLVNKGLIYPDGKTVKKSLDEVALELQKMYIQPTEKYLMKLFVRPDGGKYSPKACKSAVHYANYTVSKKTA